MQKRPDPNIRTRLEIRGLVFKTCWQEHRHGRPILTSGRILRRDEKPHGFIETASGRTLGVGPPWGGLERFERSESRGLTPRLTDSPLSHGEGRGESGRRPAKDG